jgi:hypothetical protein
MSSFCKVAVRRKMSGLIIGLRFERNLHSNSLILELEDLLVLEFVTIDA